MALTFEQQLAQKTKAYPSLTLFPWCFLAIGNGLLAIGYRSTLNPQPSTLDRPWTPTLDFGLGTLDLGPWTFPDRGLLWTLDFGLWTWNLGPWTLDFPSTVDRGPWTSLSSRFKPIQANSRQKPWLTPRSADL